MKKRVLFLMGCTMLFALVQAQDMSGVRIYINPGHGGYDSDDRNMVVYPYTSGDPEGFWESKSNLYKGLALRDMLETAGADVKMSRVTNTTADDRSLSAIVAEANQYDADFMLSIHSNAGVTNYVLMLYAGVDENDTHVYPTPTPCSDESRAISTVIAQNLYSNRITCWGGNYTVRGDKSFGRTAMGWSDGYGVLRGLAVPGVISEGCMHDYIPETYRLLNDDYKWLEAWHFFKSFCTYFKTAEIPMGVVAGSVRDGSNKILFPEFYKIKGSRDELLPLHGAHVYLMQGEDTVQDYVTDSLYNGVYVFKNVQPGEYRLSVVADDYYEYVQNITVLADSITYFNFGMSKVRSTPPEVIAYEPCPASPADSVECSTDIVLQFNWDMVADSTMAAFSITPEVEGTLAMENSQKTLRFSPNGSLEPATNYTVRLTTQACHPDTAHPNHLEQDFVLQFVTKKRGNLSLLQSYPFTDAVQVPLRPSFILIYDQKLKTASVRDAVSVVDMQGTEMDKNVRSFTYNRVDEPYGHASFELVDALQPESDYKLVIGPTLTDNIGIMTGTTVEIPFRTGTETEPDATVINELDTLVFVYDAARSRSVNTASVFRNTTKKLYGTASNELRYDFADLDGEICYAAINPAAVLATSEDMFGMHVFADFSFNELWAEFSVDGDIKYAKVCDMDYAGWQYHQVSLQDVLPENVTYQFCGLKLVRQDSFLSASGSVYVDNMTLCKISETALSQTGYKPLSVYPNPASDEVWLTGSVNAPALLQVYSLSGKLLKCANASHMDVYDLPVGTYVLQARAGDDVYCTPLFVVR